MLISKGVAEIYEECSRGADEKSCGRMFQKPRYQSGQSMLIGLVICTAAILAWLSMLETGKRVHDKSSLNRATDAAAYSAALIHARALNMHAYLNRAQLGHQLAMAHLIAVATTYRFSKQMSNQALKRNPPPSLIGTFFGPQHGVAYAAAIGAGMGSTYTLNTFRDAFLRHEHQVHHVLNQIRQAQIKEFERDRERAIHRMLIANIGNSGDSKRGESLEQLGLKFSLVIDDTKDFVNEQSANDGLWRDFLTKVVNQYGFLTERNNTKRNMWLVNPRCPFKRHELRRRGRLQLDQSGQWSSEDTLSFHALRHNKFIGCYQREYPMGWAVLNTDGTGSVTRDQTVNAPDFSKQTFWRWARHQSAGGWNIFSGRHNPLANRYAQSVRLKWDSKGLGTYAQLEREQGRRNARLAIQVTQSINRNDDEIHSFATAQSYFDPPKNAPTHSASLFQPYWRATLIPRPHSK